MDKPHKQVMTTSPVAINLGQGRLHVADEHRGDRENEIVHCPDCETFFVLTGKFPKEMFLETMKANHKKKEGHPDLIPSAPAWTSIIDCSCNMSH
jgi:hypothetical protein